MGKQHEEMQQRFSEALADFLTTSGSYLAGTGNEQAIMGKEEEVN